MTATPPTTHDSPITPTKGWVNTFYRHYKGKKRLRIEGMHITGRPQMRRKVTRTIAVVDGKEMIVKTIFELDGTTKTFMVPLFTKHPMQRIREVFTKVLNEAFGVENSPEQLFGPPKLWIPAHERLISDRQSTVSCSKSVDLRLTTYDLRCAKVE